MDQKADWKRQAPTTAPSSCSSRTPILNEIFTDHWKPTEDTTQPPQHQNWPSMPLHHPHTMTQPTSCVGGATPPHHNQQPFYTLTASSSS